MILKFLYNNRYIKKMLLVRPRAIEATMQLGKEIDNFQKQIYEHLYVVKLILNHLKGPNFLKHAYFMYHFYCCMANYLVSD